MKELLIIIGGFHIDSPHGTHTAILHLAASISQNVETIVLSDYNSYSEEEILSAKHYGFKLSSLKRRVSILRATIRFVRLVNEYRNTRKLVIHFQYVRQPYHLLLAIILRILAVPYIVSLHGGYERKCMRTRSVLFKYLYLYVVDIWILSLCNKIHCVTEEEKKDVQRMLPHLADDRFIVLSNVFSPTAVSNSQPEGLANKSLDADSALRIIYIGRIDPVHKGLDYFCSIVDQCQGENEREQVQVSFYGPINEKDIQHVKQMENSYEFLRVERPVFGPDKYQVLRSSRVFVLPSRWELYGYSLVEAVCEGCFPIVSSNCSIAELFPDSLSTRLTYDIEKDVEVMNKLIINMRRDKLISQPSEGLPERSTLAGIYRNIFDSSKLTARYLEMYFG